MVAWCARNCLARLPSLEHLDDPSVRSEIETALQTTLNQISVGIIASAMVILAILSYCCRQAAPLVGSGKDIISN